MKPDLAEHLRYYAELGVDGFSTDASWRRRPKSPPPVPTTTGPGSEETVTPAIADVESQAGSRSEESHIEYFQSAVHANADAPGTALAAIRADLGDCTRCRLHGGRTHLVFGVGNPDADLMFVGEGPGADEDEQGVPFVGRAGQLLTQIIRAMGFEREDVYIANVVKCRPPGNRNPEPDEIEQCAPFLLRQIEAVRPVVIVALGKFAAQALLRTTEPISRLRGRFSRLGEAQLMPTFHPSYLLRNPSAKREVWEDMKQVMAALRAEGEDAPRTG